MQESLLTLAFAAIPLAASPALATTFPSLTTIYVGSGVRDDGGGADTGLATTFHCSNVSGADANLRFLVLRSTGAIAGQATAAVAHGGSLTVSTHFTSTFFPEVDLGTGTVSPGAINIESTESAVFCTAAIIDAADVGEGIALHLIRVNPHPGTVE